jgi:hypothetical protein
MKQEDRVIRRTEMAFFKDVKVFYDSTLDHCGDIRKSLSLLKKHLDKSRQRLPPAKWDRLYGALMSGEITPGKRSTPGDWAEREAKLLRGPRPPGPLDR